MVGKPMSTKSTTIGSAILEGIWQTSRYALGTGITLVVLAILPALAVVIFAIVGGICTVGLSLLMLVSAVSGAADPPIVPLFLAVVLPIGFVVAMVAVFVITLLGVLLFTVLIVLPTSLLTEIVLQHIPVRSTLARVASFLFAGGVMGVVVSAVWILFNLQTNALTAAIIGIILFLTCILSVSLFGLTLTMAETTRMVLSKIVSKLYVQFQPQTRNELSTLQTDKPGEPSLVIG